MYTQLYLDYLSDKDPATVKLFDESGFQIAGQIAHWWRMRGCSSHLSTANRTLNFLVGLDGVKYANKIEVASNSYEFLSFFYEASQTEDFDTQHPVLEVYDIIVVDDLAAHHGEERFFLMT